jgi:hypothetical protein
LKEASSIKIRAVIGGDDTKILDDLVNSILFAAEVAFFRSKEIEPSPKQRTIEAIDQYQTCEVIFLPGSIHPSASNNLGDVAQLVRALPSNSHQENKALTSLVSMLVSALIG